MVGIDLRLYFYLYQAENNEHLVHALFKMSILTPIFETPTFYLMPNKTQTLRGNISKTEGHLFGELMKEVPKDGKILQQELE